MAQDQGGPGRAGRARSLADEDIVRARHCPRTNGGQWLAFDGTVVKVRLDRKATSISVLAAIGVRRDGRDRCCFP